MKTTKLMNIVALFLLVGTLAGSGVSRGLRSNQENEAKRAAPVGVGDKAPDFTLRDQQGKQITLSSARGKTPTVLVFFRGYW